MGISRPEKRAGILSKPAALKDIINYRIGSIVSRQMISGKSGNVTLFAFDKAERLSEHISAYNALVEIIEGEAQISVSGRNYRLKKGEALLMPSGKPHAVKAVKKFKMVLTLIK